MSYNSTKAVSITGHLIRCFKLSSTTNHLIAYVVVCAPFVIPLCYIFYCGVQQLRNRAKISHTDIFTYNFVTIQLVAFFGSASQLFSMIMKSELILELVISVYLINTAVLISFQILTCLERYMAVVHPVTYYLSLKSQTWTTIRNLTCVFVWGVSIIQSCMMGVIESVIGYFTYCLIGISVSFIIVVFCNVCVLHKLLRPRPGDGVKDSVSKQKAFYTIAVITGALLLKFGGGVLCVTLYLSYFDEYNSDSSCVLFVSEIWFTLPSTLVLPILYLHRNGKLQCK
ncbi:unnamed protein product [Knipowitschia caucasica]